MPEQAQPAISPIPPPAFGEDPFFILKNCRELFQRRLADIVQQCGITTPAIVEAFTHAVGETHDALAAATQQLGFEQTEGLTASRISLVGHDDLELEIRINDVIHRLKGNERIEHWRAQLRYMTLLKRPQMIAEQNPVGLEPICQGLWAICTEGGGTLEKKLERLDRLEEMLQLRLPDIYQELNCRLDERQIAPAQVAPVQRGSSDNTTAGAPSALQRAVQQQCGIGDGTTGGAIGTIPTAPDNFALNASAMVMLNHMIERLNALEAQNLASLAVNAPESTGESALPRTFKAKDLGFPLGDPTAIALDTLSLIFEAIFAAPDLPDVVKAAIGRLQIPLLKQAILDASFFADTQHPARQLINRTARTALGLPTDSGRDDPVCARLSQIADSARATLESGDADLTPRLAELNALIEEREQTIQAQTQPYLDLVEAHEKRELARLNADAWLSTTLAKTSEPAIAAFLKDHWRQVMLRACLEGGLTGTNWKENAATIDALFWSIQPKQSAEERQKLTSMIPTLIKRINGGLDDLQTPTTARQPFLDACFDLQTAALRNRPAAEPVTTAPAAEPSATDQAGNQSPILQDHGKLVHYLGQPGLSQTKSVPSPATQGQWLAFQLPDGERLCGRHCGQTAAFGTVLLYNPAWGYAVALAPEHLGQQLKNGQATRVSDNQLFDVAAEQALQRLKPS